MRVIKWLSFLSVIFLVSMNGLADENAVPEQGLNAGFDYVSFRGGENHTYVELYFSLYVKDLTYIPDADKFKSEFQFEVQLFDKDSMVAGKKWRNSHHLDSLAQQNDNQKLYGINFLQTKPGAYKMHVKAIDVASGKNVENSLQVEIPQIQSDSLSMSELQFATDIQRTETKNQYYKNGYQVIPNTEHLYGVGLPMLMFYFELYNLKQPAEVDTNHYEVKYSILNNDKAQVRSFPSRKKLKPGNSAVEIGGVNIITLLSGTYYLQVDVIDLYSKKVVSRVAKFFVYRAADYEQTDTDSTRKTVITQQRTQLIESAYQVMKETEIDDEFGACTYIATREEKTIFKKLDLAGKRQFIIQFWAQRDETPNTPNNEFRDNYLNRVRVAEKEYGSSFKKGWKVDEGRILLVYGIPDEIERFPSSTENKAYRIWHYYSIQGGVQFVFVDRRQWGEYELVHSTARGELFDEDWNRWIDPTQ
jgi:GWxTD domain-containing protein